MKRVLRVYIIFKTQLKVKCRSAVFFIHTSSHLVQNKFSTHCNRPVTRISQKVLLSMAGDCHSGGLGAADDNTTIYQLLYVIGLNLNIS